MPSTDFSRDERRWVHPSKFCDIGRRGRDACIRACPAANEWSDEFYVSPVDGVPFVDSVVRFLLRGSSTDEQLHDVYASHLGLYSSNRLQHDVFV